MNEAYAEAAIKELERKNFALERQCDDLNSELADMASDLDGETKALQECRETLESILGQIENTLKNTR